MKLTNKKLLVLLISGAILAILFYSWLETRRIEINHITIKGNAPEHNLKGKTIVHLSDLHIKKTGKKELTLSKQIKALDPDIIFLTGDYVKWNGNYEASLKFLSMLNANIGIWAVMGDCDYSNSRKSCLFCHNKGEGSKTSYHNIHFLRNTVECIDIGDKQLCVGGIDTLGEDTNMLNFSRNNGSVTIILSHNPLNFDLFDSSQHMLMLSGDTHGGQIPLPSWLWRILGYNKNAKYNYGLFSEGNKKMFVTKGVGNSHLPFRFFCRPEIVVYHF